MTIGTSEEEVLQEEPPSPEVRVRRLHRRDLNRCWDFLVLVFRDVNRETVEYQRPRSKKRFCDIYEEDEAEQLLFEAEGEIVGYAECTFEIGSGSDNWLNPRYFEKRNMRPMFVEELAVHPRMQGRGVGGFMIDQLQHLARLRGCTHLVLEVAENNRDALTFYRRRNFQKMDAAIFMAQKIESPADLLPPRTLKKRGELGEDGPEPLTEGLSGDSRSSRPPKRKRGKGITTVELETASPPAPKRKRGKIIARVELETASPPARKRIKPPAKKKKEPLP